MPTNNIPLSYLSLNLTDSYAEIRHPTQISLTLEIALGNGIPPQDL